MAIKAGERMPAGTLKRMTKEGPKDLSTDELFTLRPFLETFP